MKEFVKRDVKLLRISEEKTPNKLRKILSLKYKHSLKTIFVK